MIKAASDATNSSQSGHNSVELSFHKLVVMVYRARGQASMIPGSGTVLLIRVYSFYLRVESGALLLQQTFNTPDTRYD
jgi:hypothetical protein